MILTSLVIVVALVALSAVITAVGARMIERAHPPSGRFVDVAGGRLHVLDLEPREPAGADDTPIVLIHGASANLEEMRLALGDALSRRHRVILVDRPGHGWSERSPDEAFSPARQAAMVSEMLDRLGVRRAVIVAHSFGTTVATALALDDPTRVAGLVLIAPATHPRPGAIAWYYRLASAPVIGPLFVRTLALPAGWLLLGPTVAVVFAPQEAPADYAERAAIALVLRPQNFLANARDVAGRNAFVTVQEPRYATIKAPTTIITGDSDSVVSPQVHSQGLATALPHSKLIVLEGVGHVPHYVALDRVVTAIEEIMADVGKR
jgi:pimeloyl-ACP methyl ester carboxylesterase